MKVAIAGNYSISPESVATHLLQQMASLPIDAEILLRLPQQGGPGPVESLAESLARPLGIQSHWRIPTVGSGREGTIERDFRMVDEADELIVYFEAGHVMDEDRGTTRLVQHALSTGKPVHAYAPQDEGEPVFVGSGEKEAARG
jgi:hypothetical protein